tara:strand:+ start:350 stop:751 length:402 start_codon:yes stop_codon:yes gene_type:complete
MSETAKPLTFLPGAPVVINLQNGYRPLDLKADNRVRVVVIAIFWVAFFLNCVSQVGRIGDTEAISVTFEGLASVLYAVNLVFLILGRVPGRGPLAGPGCDCRCSCMSRPYAVASTVLFAFSISGFILDFVFLG